MIPDDRPLDRMLELRLWLYSLGACWHCRHEVASAEVIREMTGNRAEVRPCPDKAPCLEVARAHWKERPMFYRLDTPAAPTKQPQAPAAKLTPQAKKEAA